MSMYVLEMSDVGLENTSSNLVVGPAVELVVSRPVDVPENPLDVVEPQEYGLV